MSARATTTPITMPAMAPAERPLDFMVPVTLPLVALEESAFKVLQDDCQSGAFVAGVILVSPTAIVLILAGSASGPGAWPSQSVEEFQFCAKNADCKKLLPRVYGALLGVQGLQGKYCRLSLVSGFPSVRFINSKGTLIVVSELPFEKVKAR